MCEALRELMKEEFEEERNKAITEGLAQGRAQGLEQGRAQGLEQGMAQGIFDLGKEFGLSKAEILSRIEKKLSIPPDTAEKYYDNFSKNQPPFVDAYPVQGALHGHESVHGVKCLELYHR